MKFTDTARVITNASLRQMPDAELELDDLEPGQVVSGSPKAGASALLRTEDIEIGIWQHTVGVSTDVEADEAFIVIHGRATIDIQDGPTLEVGPGDIGLLPEGACTVWTIHETLRKVYLTAAQ